MSLEDYKESTCSCKRCIKRCELRPCWGTPQEIEKLIHHNIFSKFLMLDWWESYPERIYIIAPAIVGYENQKAPYRPIGKCIFLKEDSCILHSYNLKPFEGRVASCDENLNYNKNPHKDVAMTWDTDEGKELVALWKKINNLIMDI